MVDLLKIQTEMVRLAESLDYHHGFVCHPVAFKVPFVKGWQELNESYKGELWGKAPGVGIKTGCGHVTVVHIDKPDVPFFDKFVKHFDIKPTTWVITPGGGIIYISNIVRIYRMGISSRSSGTSEMTAGISWRRVRTILITRNPN